MGNPKPNGSRNANGESLYRKPDLSPHDTRRVAVRAGCDPRTVLSYLKGRPTSSTTISRIVAALERRGFGKLIRDEQATKRASGVRASSAPASSR